MARRRRATRRELRKCAPQARKKMGIARAEGARPPFPCAQKYFGKFYLYIVCILFDPVLLFLYSVCIPLFLYPFCFFCLCFVHIPVYFIYDFHYHLRQVTKEE